MPLPASVRKLRAFLQAERFDVLHVQVPYSPFFLEQVDKGNVEEISSKAETIDGTLKYNARI